MNNIYNVYITYIYIYIIYLICIAHNADSPSQRFRLLGLDPSEVIFTIKILRQIAGLKLHRCTSTWPLCWWKLYFGGGVRVWFLNSCSRYD